MSYQIDAKELYEFLDSPEAFEKIRKAIALAGTTSDQQARLLIEVENGVWDEEAEACISAIKQLARK